MQYRGEGRSVRAMSTMSTYRKSGVHSHNFVEGVEEVPNTIHFFSLSSSFFILPLSLSLDLT
jgi:hypothetical protein